MTTFEKKHQQAVGNSGLAQVHEHYCHKRVRESATGAIARIEARKLNDRCNGSDTMVDLLSRGEFMISREWARNIRRCNYFWTIYKKQLLSVRGCPSDRPRDLARVKVLEGVAKTWETDKTNIPHT